MSAHVKQVPGVEIRYTTQEDAPFLAEWLKDPSVKDAFPMDDAFEVNDAVQRWIAFAHYRCSLTALKEGKPCGLATLYLQPYRKLAHQCEFGIIIDAAHRNLGIGSLLLEHLIHLAKDTFRIELLHLQVYEKNPAKELYERFGFKSYGHQERWLKNPDGTFVGRLFMEKEL
ncbi:MAG: GNAT family N-acetyltransferase [Chlamydiia bacterium]|nr:GNAT family N-acetyltransferase [Chlamydiia bacterium]